jgi:hypothetical protein
LLGTYDSAEFWITDFAFHSICLILFRLNHKDALRRFVHDAFVDGSVTLVQLSPDDTERIIEVVDQFRLDFDDAYQYVVAEKYQLTLVSFDSHLDATPLGRKTPSDLLPKT